MVVIVVIIVPHSEPIPPFPLVDEFISPKKSTLFVL